MVGMSGSSGVRLGSVCASATTFPARIGGQKLDGACGATVSGQGVHVKLIDSFRKLSANARGVVSAEVVTAQPLSAAQAKGVAAALRTALGKDPEISTRVDPAILGGIKVRVGSRLFDASLKSKLDSLKFALKRA